MRLLLIFFMSSWFASCYVKADEVRSYTLSEDNEFIVRQFNAAHGDTLLLWIASAYGFDEPHSRAAETLAKNGFTVWQTDLLESLFLTRSVQNMRTLSGHWVAELVEQASAETGKQVFLLGDQSATMPMLHGAHAWQIKHPQQRDLGGLLLFSPSLYQQVPQLGEDAQYLPVVSANRLPVFIFQAESDGNRWYLPALLKTLYASGSAVYAELLPGVRNPFSHEQVLPAETRLLQKLPNLLNARLPLLRNAALAPLTQNSLKLPAINQDSGIDQQLKPYQGKIQPMPIELPDIHGQTYSLIDYRGRVTLVNFWASWCPPCVQEIPSLNRLREQMRDQPFSLISINYAESRLEIEQFMQRVAVHFPVLMDSAGQVAAQWKVFAFPSTFIIDSQGQIAYGVNAGLEWDTPEVVNTLQGLLKSQKR